MSQKQESVKLNFIMNAILTMSSFVYVALRKETSEAFGGISYWKMLLGLLAGSFGSFWFVRFEYGSFLTLFVTACLFFGIYGIVLLLTGETLTLEIFHQVTGRAVAMLRHKTKDKD